MKKILFIFMLAVVQSVSTQAQYQLANSNFEDGWDNVSYGDKSGVEPKNWNSFLTGTGSKKNMALGQTTLASASGLDNVITSSTETYDKNKSNTCVQLKPYSVKPIIGSTTLAQANMTNGCINLGDATADKWTGNYNYTNVGTEGQYGAFSGKPDAIHVWVKFKSTVKYGAKVSCVLHDNTNSGYMQDPYQNFTYVTNDNGTSTKTTNYTLSSSVKLANVVAHASKTDIQNSDDWQELNLPLVYDNSSLTPSYALVSFATSSAPGKGNIDDVLWVDDLEFIYYSELSSATYDENEVIFDEDGLATVDAEYDASLLALYKAGKGGTIEEDYNTDSGLLTITVKGDNYGTAEECAQDPTRSSTNFHTYKIQFNVQPQMVSSKTYSEDLYITITEDGISQTTEKQVANVLVETFDNGKINFVLKNFYLNGAAIGNIEVSNIEKLDDGSFAFNGEITIADGDDSDETWWGPELGEVPLDLSGRFIGEDHVVVYIAINIGDQAVDVHLGYARATMAVDTAAKYGTFCAPYAVAVPGGVQAYTVSSVVDRILTLDEVAQTIPANTPVVLYADNGLTSVESFGIAVSGTPTFGLLTGVYESTQAPVGSYVLQNIDETVGFYQVASGKQPIVGANRCYLTVSSDIKAFFFNEDDATGIKNIDDLENNNGVIYNLAGQRISKMQKGINIINGKKILK